MFDLENFLTELKNEQMKKLEALNGNISVNNTDNSSATTGSSSATKPSSSFQFPISYLEKKRRNKYKYFKRFRTS